MTLTDAEIGFQKAEKVSVYPAPYFTRSPVQESAGWEVRLLRGSELVGYGRGATREEALESAKRDYHRKKR